MNESIVTSDVWYAMWAENGTAYYSPDVYYDDETVYFAVIIGGINHETLSNLGMCFCGACSFKLNCLSERDRNERI